MVQKYEQVVQPLPLKKIIFNNFIGGLAWAVGATIGLSLIITLVTIIVHYVNFVPIVGNFISQVLDFVLKNNHTIQR